MSAGKGKGTSADATSAAVDKKTPQVQRVIEHMQNIGNFIGALDGYEPTIPEQVTRYQMQKGGVEAGDPRMVKLLSLAADHFLAKTIYEARQMSLLRTQIGPSSKALTKAAGKRKANEMANAAAAMGVTDAKQMEDLFRLEDLTRALSDQGVHISCKRS